MPPATDPALSPEHIAFVQSGVSMAAASRDRRHVPSLARAYGCRADADGRRLSVYVAPSQAAALIRDVEQCRMLAVVFSRPSSHETIQIKGSDAVVRPLGDGDWEQVQRLCAALLADIVQLGYDADGVRTMLSCAQEDMVALSFTPEAVFAQSPGPRAGERLPR